MPEVKVVFPVSQPRSNRIRLRTMILMRWVAAVGQLAAVTVAQQIFDLQFAHLLCYFAISISVISNLVATFSFPQNKRLTEIETLITVLFDLLQLSLLLYLTGGLKNPFALLILGPITISATVMNLRSILIIGGTAIFLVTLMSQFYLPLCTGDGADLQMLDIYIFGNWLAIVIAILFIGAYARRISSEMHSMSEALAATQMALSREQKLTDIGGVVATAAHELGTPLATIKLTSDELIEALDDRPDLCGEAALIREQVDRCRDILRDMGRAGKADLDLRQVPLTTVIDEAAEPHKNRGTELHFEAGPGHGGQSHQPSVLRRPEIIHGLRNLIQNGVDFARANVWVEAIWTENIITIRILDDGCGYPAHLLGRIGDPFVRRRCTEADQRARPEYEGMGLGLFIAKTLLERSGAVIRFANGSDPYQTITMREPQCGAIVEVNWPRSKIDAQSGENAIPFGTN
ncbi:MAG: ActS/PrrB/RegB family redox-sensitive histidine kinase [Rhodobacteraceae bacterium]|nr:ActS/PrrB/RegB family redox-sensitive histidine kinase [Paracoccaceae bacterium]